MTKELATDPAMIEIEKQQRAAYDANDYATLELYLAIGSELKRLREVGSVAARVYEDHSDENAWWQLFEALSDAGLL